MAFLGAVRYKSATLTGQDLTAGADMSFDTLLYDIGGWDDGVNDDRFVVPTGVKFVHIEAAIGFLNTDGLNRGYTISVWKNGAPMVPSNAFRNSSNVSNPRSFFSSYLIPVEEGDYFIVRARYDTDTSVDIDKDFSWFGIWAVPETGQTVTNNVMCVLNADLTSQNITAANTAVAWDGADVYDNGGWHNPASNNTKIIIPTGVNYAKFKAQMHISGHTANEWYLVAIYKNGSQLPQGCQVTMAANAASRVVNIETPWLPVESGDEFEVYHRAQTDTTINLEVEGCWFCAESAEAVQFATDWVDSGSYGSTGTSTRTWANVDAGEADSKRVVVGAFTWDHSFASNITGVTINGYTANYLQYNGGSATGHVGLIYGENPTGINPSIVVTLSGAPTAISPMHVWYGYPFTSSPMDFGSSGGSGGVQTINNLSVGDGGIVITANQMESASDTNPVVWGWNGTDSITDKDSGGSTGNFYSMADIFITENSAVRDLTSDPSGAPTAILGAVSFCGPATPTSLDAFAPTGAFSLSRNLISTFGGSRYADTGGAITTIYDQSGNAYDATDGGVSARRPTLTTAGPNSRAAADFDGSSDYLTGSAMTNHVTVSEALIIMTVIFDVVSVSLDANFATLGHAVISDDTGRLGLFGNVDSGIDKVFSANYVTGASDTRVGLTVVETQTHVISLRHSGGNLYVSVDGGAESSVASGDTNAGMGNLRFGYRGNAYFDGKLLECVTFNTAKSATDRAFIIDFLMDWAGI